MPLFNLCPMVTFPNIWSKSLLITTLPFKSNMVNLKLLVLLFCLKKILKFEKAGLGYINGTGLLKVKLLFSVSKISPFGEVLIKRIFSLPSMVLFVVPNKAILPSSKKIPSFPYSAFSPPKFKDQNV